MGYVVYEKASTRTIDGLNGGPKKSYFTTKAAAAGARTRFLKAQVLYTADDILVEEVNKFRNEIEKTITVYSLMDTKVPKTPIVISVNTPWSCRPDSETYWSM
jgi:hypothetical protein